MRKFIILSSIAAMFSLTSFNLHPFYVGITEVRYNTANSKVQASIKLFTDDFQQAFKKFSGKLEPNAANEEDKKKVEEFLLSKFGVTFLCSNSRPQIKFTLFSWEEEEEATWFYLTSDTKIDPRDLPQNIVIYNKLLCDQHEEQLHVLHLYINNKRESQQINCEKQAYKFEVAP